MNDLLNRFMTMLRPQSAQQVATSPLTVPQAGMLNRLFGLATTQAQGAMQAAPEQLARSRQMLADWQPGQEVSPELMNQFMGLAGFAPAGITAFHGSPYLFRQLDPTKIGSGEGRQAYGTGAGYTAELRQAAEDYARKNLRGPEQVAYTASKGTTPVKDVLKMVYPGRDEAFYESAISGSKMPGYLYKGDIPDEILPKFLDFDKPLKQQSKEVQSLAKKYKVDLEDLGGDLLAKVGKGREGTQIMEDAGILGIRYIGQEGKSANFIPFRPEDYKIQEINNIPLQEWINKGLL